MNEVTVIFRDKERFPTAVFDVEEWAVGDPAPEGWIELVGEREVTFIPVDVIHAVTVPNLQQEKPF